MAKSTKKTVLFLCTGNYYRSRFAEILFDSVATKMGLPWQATSRGLGINPASGNIGPMSQTARQVLETLGVRNVEAMTRLPVPLTLADLEAAERVIALQKAEHEPMVQANFVEWREKIEYWHVEDKPGVLPLIEQEVMALVARILGGGQAPPVPITEAKAAPPAKKPIAKVGREIAGRRGKGVTTIFDLKISEAALQEMATTIKQRCGTGGTVKDGRIEIQGDQRERIVAELERLGYQVKRVGG